jgi:hypothetical protein
MSQPFAQIVPANSLRPPDGASANFSSVPHFNQTSDAARSIFRLDIRRSLQVHRRLALSLALIGLILAVIYLLNSWPIRTAQSINDLQLVLSGNIKGTSHDHMPAISATLELLRTGDVARFESRVSAVDKQFQDSARNGNSPGLASLAAAAVAPWYSADFALIRNAIVLLLSFIFLGAAVAVVAHNIDPRVYSASDVEHLLGFAPMAQLPDFSEVANEVAEEHLLRLASSIDRAFKDRDVRQCVFTGTGPGVGVTSVATRVKQLLETLGRAAVIVDVPGTSPSPSPGGEDEAALDGDRLLMLHQWVNGAEGRRGETVLADAAPLTGSQETEQLVRSANCTIVVIESGVTTRAQLRAVANTLQCIKAPLVGFVLNRVRLATADPAFRRSIKEMGRQLRTQGQATDWQMLHTLQQAIEEGRASLDLDDVATPSRPAANPPANITTDAAPFHEVVQADAPKATHQAEPDLPAAPHGLQLVPRSLPENANQTHEEIPSPLAEIASQFDTALPEPKTEHDQTSQATPGRTNGSGTDHETAKLVLEGPAHVTPPPLSELRGMCFTQALKELDLAKRPAPPSAGIEMLMNAIAPFESLFNHTGPAHSSGPAYTPEVEAEHTAAAHTLIPIPGLEIAPAAANGANAHGNGSRQVAKPGEFHPSGSAAPGQNGARREENGSRTRHGQGHAMHEQGDLLEDVQILPSKRGQYKKNDWEHRNGQR